MAKFTDVPSRGEVEGRIERDKEKMEKGEEILEDDTSDIEAIRKTLQELNFEGAKEDVEQVKGHIEGAEDITTDKFEGDDEDLEQNQAEAKEFEEETEGRKESSEIDLSRVSEASAEFKTQEAIGKFGEVKAAVLEGIEFLEEQRKRAFEAGEKSEAIQKRLDDIVRSGKGKR